MRRIQPSKRSGGSGRKRNESVVFRKKYVTKFSLNWQSFKETQMAMPPQLASAKRPPKGQSRRPILEQLPAVSANELRISSIYQGKRATIKPLKIPNIAGVKVGPLSVDFHFKSLHRGVEGPVQRFNLRLIKAGFRVQYAFVCNCGKTILKLYFWRNSLVCRYCCKGRLASQAISRTSRPILQANRIAEFLDSKSRIFKRTRERLRKRLGDKLMLAQSRLGTRAANIWE